MYNIANEERWTIANINWIIYVSIEIYKSDITFNGNQKAEDRLICILLWKY